MSTTSLLYHGFCMGVVECTKSEFSNGEIIFHVRHKSNRHQCIHCRSHNVILRGRVLRKFRTLPIGLKPCFISATLHRLKCRDCGCLRQERIGFAESYRRYTRAFARYVAELSHLTTIRDLSKHLGVSWSLIREIQEQALKKEFSKIKLKDLKRLAIDELAFGKGHDYVSIVLDLDSGAAVYVGDGRAAESIKPFFTQLKRIGARIEAVATDMAQPYHKAVLETFPKADLVIDRFHVMQLMNNKLTDLRRDLCDKARKFRHANVLKGTRWLLLRNAENLDEAKDHKKRLEKALEFNKPLSTAYYLKEDLREFWTQGTKKQADIFLKGWMARAIASGIRVMKTMANTLQRYRNYLLNYYNHPISTAPLEGFNNKAQTMKRQAYGYRNREFYKLKLKTLHVKRYALLG